LTEVAAGSSDQVDLFGQSLIGDLLDAPISVPTENPIMNNSSSEVDLFADATFVSASPQAEKGPGSETQVRYSFIHSMLLSCVLLKFEAGVSIFALPYLSTKAK
jgi:epsin